MKFELKPGDIAGFELYGERQADGTILVGTPPVGNRRRLEDFPETIELLGMTYTLEEVRRNRDMFPGPVPPIEWGLYI